MSEANHLHILQHCIGADQYGRRQHDRNHFVTGEGSTDHPACMDLVGSGLMTRRAKFYLAGGSDLFAATNAGIAHVAKHSPPPPPPIEYTRSQQRYRDFKDSETSMRFGDWLKLKGTQ